MHEDLVFDAPGRIGGQLDVPVGVVGAHRLDEPDGADGDEVFDAHAGILEPAGDVHHQPEVVLDEGGTGLVAALCAKPSEKLRFLLPAERRGEGIRAADVHDLPRQQNAQPGQR